MRSPDGKDCIVSNQTMNQTMNDFEKIKSAKASRRAKKREHKRKVTAREVIYIFQHVLLGQSTIRIYNDLRQKNAYSTATKKKVEVIATGNCRLSVDECDGPDEYQLYIELRNQVYAHHGQSTRISMQGKELTPIDADHPSVIR